MSDHIFQASGDACPICTALDGSHVPAGYQPHENCMCQTIPDDANGCEWTFEHAGNDRYGYGEFDVISGIEVTVYCADGSQLGRSGEFNGGGSAEWEDWYEGLQEAAEAIAEGLCDQCPEPEPFLCC
jgi:hypothetical protein